MKRITSTQQIAWFLDQDRTNHLDLNPPYQRKSVWTTKDRRFFLDTIFRNYPTPAIFVHRTIDDNGFTTHHIVDGKQRLETILKFAKNEIAIDPKFGDINLDGKKFKELEVEYKKMFWDYTLVVENIESIEGTNIEQVFDRVNRNSMNLQPQELRHARFNGWFINETENESELDFWWDVKVSTKSKDRRMRNVQSIAELLLIVLERKIVGFDQNYLDEMYAKYDSFEEDEENFDEDEYEIEKNRIKSYITTMEDHNHCVSIFAKTLNNLYVLWALITLNEETLPPALSLADMYFEFMTKINTISDNNLNELKTNEEIIDADNHLKYYFNSRGASTDPTPRKNRLDALKSAFSI